MSRAYISASPINDQSLNHKKIANSLRHKTLSYEDLLIGKYMEQMQTQSNSKTNMPKSAKRIEIDSPYLQKLSHSNFVSTVPTPTNINSNRTFRANSALGSRPNSTQIEKYEPYFRNSKMNGCLNTRQFDDKFNSRSNLESANMSLSLRRPRPSSAPIGQRTPLYNNKGNKSNFRRQPHMIRALAYRNGTRQFSAHIAAKNLIEFLEIATDRLQFTRAARRIFLENGDEIKDESQFLKNAVVYVSCGEDFSDPFLKTKEIIDKRKTALWTSAGVQFLEKKGSSDNNEENNLNNDEYKDYYNTYYNRNNIPKPKNDRLTRTTRITKRLVAYENGSEYNSTLTVFEIVNPAIRPHLTGEEIEKLEQTYLKDFLAETTLRLKISGLIKCVYNWEGKLIQTVDDVPKLDKCLQSLVNEVEYSPIWATRGEGFNARGALSFMDNLIRYTRQKIKELQKKKRKIEKDINNLKNEKKDLMKTAPIRMVEFNEALRQVELEINEFNTSIVNLESVRNNLQSLYDEQCNNGYQSLFKHIKSIDTNEKIFGGIASKGLKLKCILNGTDEEFEVFFNVKDWSSSAQDTESQKSQIYQLLNDVTRAINKNPQYKTVKITRLFNENGEDIKFINKLNSNDRIWASEGENWKGERDVTMAITLNLNMLFSTHNNPIQNTEENKNADNNNPDPDDSNQELKKFVKPKMFQNSNHNQFRKRNSFSLIENTNLKIYIEPLNVNMLKKYDKSDYWDVLDEQQCIEAIKENSIEYNPFLIKEDHIELEPAKTNQLLIQNRNEEKIILYPRLFLNEKKRRQSTKADSIWFHEFQIWKFNKSGYIYNQFFPKICLTVNTTISVQLDLYFKNPNANNKSNKVRNSQEFQSNIQQVVKKGYVVILSRRNSLNENETQGNFRDREQQWKFNKYGNISSKSIEDRQMVLTSTALLKKELNNLILNGNGPLDKFDFHVLDTNSAFKEINPDEVALVLLEDFDRQLMPSLASSQRWAIKQENSRSIGEWRYSELSTALWHKLALTWPVNEREELIDKFRWPINGYLIPGAPILRNLDDTGDSTRTRLRVLRNGCLDISTAQIISRMDAKHLMKQFIHCTKISYRQFEFNVFLDTVTTTLGLPNAARRVFDADGNEHFDLSNLEQNQLIYVSMGEAWIHPKTVKEEQERKFLLANLAEDLHKILYFINLKNCENFVIQTNNMQVQENNKLILEKCCLSSKQIERIKQGESIQNVIEIDEKDEFLEEEEVKKKAHQISHENADAAYAKKFRWPWETVVNKSMEGIFVDNKKAASESENENDMDQQNEQKSTDNNCNNNAASDELRDSLMFSSRSYDQELRQKFKPRPKKQPKNIKLNSQKFGINKTSGQIFSLTNQNLVLAISDTDNNSNEVFLTKKNEENIYQKWIFKQNGIIFSKAKPNMVLSVKLPSLSNFNIDLNQKDDEKFNLLINDNKSIYHETPLVILPFVETDYGNANQRWRIDEYIGFIYAFNTSEQRNVEIMAANRANLCTYYVCNDKEISQPGFVCELVVDSVVKKGEEEIQNTKIEKTLVCSSCAKLMKGKYKITKLAKNQNFICSIGKSKDRALNQFDGFKYLHNKVDLTFSEAENSFYKWLAKYNSWKQESSAKSVLNENSAAKTISMIKLFAYKNGDGRLKPGELLVGASIQELLDQATGKLQLRGAARKLYTEDGNLILDVQDLITWAVEHYKKELNKKENESSLASKRSSIKSSKQVKLDLNAVKNSLNQIKLLDKVDFGERSNSIMIRSTNDFNNSTNRADIFASESTLFKKQFVGPTKVEIKKLLNDYERGARLDGKRIFKWPLEIWVSCGEAFVSPKLISENESQKLAQREQTHKAEHELEKQTHALRQMIGRRLNSMSTGVYKSIKNPDFPVVREGHWSEVPYEEQLKKAEVDQLKNFVSEMKNPNKKIERTKSDNLYGSHPITKRIKIYLNGHSSANSQFCWASSLEELNESVKLKFRLNKNVKFFFTEDGKIISRFEDIVRDQLVCVSTGREFIPQELLHKDVEIKANWIRVRKEEGMSATNIKVTSKRNPIVDIDPFGPPLLTTSTQKIKSSTHQQLALPAPPPQTQLNNSNNDKQKETSSSTSKVVKTSTAFNNHPPKSAPIPRSIMTHSLRVEESFKEDNKIFSTRKPKSKSPHHKKKSKSTSPSTSRSPKRVHIKNGRSKEKHDKEDDDDEIDDDDLVEIKPFSSSKNITNRSLLNSSSFELFETNKSNSFYATEAKSESLF